MVDFFWRAATVSAANIEHTICYFIDDMRPLPALSAARILWVRGVMWQKNAACTCLSGFCRPRWRQQCFSLYWRLWRDCSHFPSTTVAINHGSWLGCHTIVDKILIRLPAIQERERVHSTLLSAKEGATHSEMEQQNSSLGFLARSCTTEQPDFQKYKNAAFRLTIILFVRFCFSFVVKNTVVSPDIE